MLQTLSNILKFVSVIINLDFVKTIICLDYWKEDKAVKQDNDELKYDDPDESYGPVQKFVIDRPGDCIIERQYGFATGQPCVLVKMNKVKGNKIHQYNRFIFY
jgi:hypothetical protein